MSVFRIVYLENGQYAVQKLLAFIKWGYCGKKDNYVWTEEKHIMDYCLMNTLSEAENSLDYIIAEVKDSRIKRKIPRVVKVIKKVRV